MNRTFEGVVVAPAQGGARRHIEGLDLTVIWPDQVHLERLRRLWRGQSLAAATPDTSNHQPGEHRRLGLEFADRRMLLTGDARGDHIIDGLERAGLMADGGRLEVDVLKVQHHGSDRKSRRAFFERVWARHYVISANGRDDNPSPATVQSIVDVRGPGGGYEVHLTNCGERGTPLGEMVERFRRAYPGIFRCRSANEASIRLVLDEER